MNSSRFHYRVLACIAAGTVVFGIALFVHIRNVVQNQTSPEQGVLLLPIETVAVTGSISPQSTCTDPVVVTDASSQLQLEAGAPAGAKVANNNTFTTPIFAKSETGLTIYSGDGKICFVEAVADNSTHTITLSPEGAAATINPVDGRFNGITFDQVKKFPSYPAYLAYLTENLKSALLSDLVTTPEYQALYTNIQSDVSARAGSQ